MRWLPVLFAAAVILVACDRPPVKLSARTELPAGPIPLAARSACSSSVASPAGRLLDLANCERAERGIAALTARGDVTAIAQEWSEHMAADGAISHNDSFFTAATKARLGAKALGENVGTSGSIDDVHDRLMASAPHRANLLDARFTVVGMGAVADGGAYWITQDFLQPAGSVAAPAPPPSTSTTPRPATTRPEPPSSTSTARPAPRPTAPAPASTATTAPARTTGTTAATAPAPDPPAPGPVPAPAGPPVLLALGLVALAAVLAGLVWRRR